MSALISFNGNPALKMQCIERIEKYRDSQWLNPVMHAVWEPEHKMCTPMGALLESADVDKFEAVTGISCQLAFLYQSLVGVSVVSVPNKAFAGELHKALPLFVLPEAILEHWTAWLDVIDVGGKVPDLFAHDLLSSDHPVAPLSSSIRAQLSTVVHLFESEADGQVVEAQKWADARKRCVELTDAMAVADGRSDFEKPIAEFFESVCWSWAGDYTEPLQSLRSLAQAVTGVLADQMLSPSDHKVIAGQRAAMEQYMVEAQEDPKKFDPNLYFEQSKGLKTYWGFEFQQVLAERQLQITPLVGGRMLVGLVECIKKYQTK
jgi:hypothetical protein